MAETSFGEMTHMRPAWLFLKTLLISYMFFHPGIYPVNAQPLPGPQAFLAETRFEFPAVFEGQEVYHEFVIQNKGDVLLEITDVRTD
jgi:hypothetical protein